MYFFKIYASCTKIIVDKLHNEIKKMLKYYCKWHNNEL